jgi:calcineurin-like phosphoesterase family protein
MNQLIRCKNCDEIIMKTPFDQYPEYEWDTGRSPENFRSIEKDDFQDFLIHHHGHQLENLKIIEDTFVSERAYFEPIKTSFFKATNGKEKFVIKKFREKIDEPLKYQLISGDYSLKCNAIEIQSEEISKRLKRELKSPLSQSQIAAFLKLYRTIVENINVHDLERISEESPYPLEIYYKIDDLHLMYLLRNCRNLFKGQEYSAMEEFIHRHKDDGVLLLKATYKIQLTEIPKPGEKAVPVLLPLEKEKITAKK